MKNTTYKNLIIGNMIKEIATRKGVSSKEISNCIGLYQSNPHKIYGLDDMDSEDVIKISYLMKYNLLQVISKEYLSHLPLIENHPDNENYYMELDAKTGHYKIIGDIENANALSKVYVGKHIRKFAEKNGWSGQYMAKLLQCSESTVSNLYDCKSLKIKKLMSISDDLQYNFIAEVYLSRMFITSSPDMLSKYTITFTSQEVRFKNPDDNTLLMVFCRRDDEK